MKTLVLILTILMAGSASAAEVTLQNGVRAASDIPAVKLPINVKNMTPLEFSRWCEAYNAGQVAYATANHEQYLTARGPLKTAHIVEHIQSNKNRVGGGVGYGGLGGAGGYAGYDNQVNQYAGAGAYGGAGYGQGSYGGNYLSGQGNASQSKQTMGNREYDTEFPDLDDDGGGPITIINPFCYAYWTQHCVGE